MDAIVHEFNEGHYRRQGTDMRESHDRFTIALGVECKISYLWRPSCDIYPIDVDIQEFHKFRNVGRCESRADANARDIFGSTPL